MKRYVKAIGLAMLIAAAFGIGMWFMYFIMWTDVFTKFIEMADKVFVS
jgi:hypothetical protein